MVIPLVIVVALGIVELINDLKSNHKKIFYFSLVILLIYSMLKLYSSVIVLNEYYRTRAWEYGWQQTAQTIKSLPNKNEPIVVDNSRNVGYIQLAFFLKADPALYQKQNFEVTPSEYYTNLKANGIKYIGNITLRGINWEKDLLVKEYLIGDDLAISNQQIKEHNLTLIKDIKYPDGTVAYRIVETNLSPRH